VSKIHPFLKLWARFAQEPLHAAGCTYQTANHFCQFNAGGQLTPTSSSNLDAKAAKITPFWYPLD